MDARFDPSLRGGRVIDPASGRDGSADTGISDGRGLSLPEVVATVTSDLLRGRFTLSDNSGEKIHAQEMLTPAFAIRAGRMVAADSAPIPPAALLAA